MYNNITAACAEPTVNTLLFHQYIHTAAVYRRSMATLTRYASTVANTNYYFATCFGRYTPFAELQTCMFH